MPVPRESALVPVSQEYHGKLSAPWRSSMFSMELAPHGGTQGVVRKWQRGASLVAWWWRIRLPTIWEYPVWHRQLSHVPQLPSLRSGARGWRLLSPGVTSPEAWEPRSRFSATRGALTPQLERSPCSPQLEKSLHSKEDPAQPELINKIISKNKLAAEISRWEAREYVFWDAGEERWRRESGVRMRLQRLGGHPTWYSGGNPLALMGTHGSESTSHAAAGPSWGCVSLPWRSGGTFGGRMEPWQKSQSLTQVNAQRRLG